MLDSRGARVRPWRRGVLAFAAAFWLFDLVVLRAGVPDPLDDTWEYGVVARALLAGRGFVTGVIHPPLWSLRDAHGAVPVLVHGPLLPLLLAPFMRVFGAGLLDHVAWLAAGLALLAASATFSLAARRVSAPVAAAAAALLTISPLAVRAVHHDVALLAGAAALAFALDLAARPPPLGLAAGVVLALGALARPEFLYAAPVVLAVARGARLRTAAAFLAGIAPWAWHGWVHAGAPWFNLSSYLLVGYSPAWPGLSAMRDFTLAPAQWPHVLREHLGLVVGKSLRYFPHALKRVLTTPGAATGWLAPLVLGFGLTRTQARALAPAGRVPAPVPPPLA